MKKLEDFLVTGLLNEQDSKQEKLDQIKKRRADALKAWDEGKISPDDYSRIAWELGKEEDIINGRSSAPSQQQPTSQPQPQPTAQPQQSIDLASIPDDQWDWREHTPEENRQRGRVKQRQREAIDRQRSPKYYSTKTGISGTPKEQAMVARNKAEQRLASGEELGPNELFYLQYIGQGANKTDAKGMLQTSGTKMSPEDIARTHGYKSSELPTQQNYSLPSATSILPDSDLAPSTDRISSAYWPTYEDFYKATGQKYDVFNPSHKQIFFDLVSRGESTVAPTAGVGQGPAYDSLEYHTMRRRPASLPKYDQYGRVPDQTYSGTWSGSDPAMGPNAAAQRQRNRAEINAAERRELAAQPLPGPSKDELEKVSKELGMSPQDLVNRSGYASQRYGILQTGLDSQRRDYYADEIRRDLESSGSRTIDDSQIPPSKPGQGRHMGDTDQQRGQFNIADMDLGPEPRPVATEPFDYDGDMQRRAKTVIPARTRRKEITRGVGAPINQGINALVAAAQTAGQKLNDYLKVNLAQTMPTTMATKLYGEPETANVPFDNVQRGQFPIDMYYDPEQRTGILDPSIVSRTTMPSYDTRTGEFVVGPRRAFQRNSPLPINVQQFMDRLYRMSR